MQKGRRVGQQDPHICSTDRTPCFHMMTMRCYIAAGPDANDIPHAAQDAAFLFFFMPVSRKGRQALSIMGCTLTKPCQSTSSASYISKLVGVTEIFILVCDDQHPSLFVVSFPISTLLVEVNDLPMTLCHRRSTSTARFWRSFASVSSVTHFAVSSLVCVGLADN